MSDITTIRDENIIASEINYIKRRTCEKVLSASVEIGRLLCEAKKTVKQGEWMSWLSESVSYSQSTANNLMRLYEEYGEKEQIGFFAENKLEIFGEISPSQALALVALPYDMRKEYIHTHDMSQTSVRDIEAEIKARKTAEERADSLQNEIEELKSNANVEKAEHNAEIRELNKLIKQLESQTSESQEQLQGIDLDAERDKIREEISKQHQKELKKLSHDNEALKKKLQVGENALVQKFSVHFEIFQKEFLELINTLSELDKEQEETSLKLRTGLKKVIESFAQSAEKSPQ